MTDITQYPIFYTNMSTLKETSIDPHEEAAEYMTQSQNEVVNFDSVKNDYIRDLKLNEPPKSSDALLLGNDGHWTFIEFKNGYMDKKKEFDVRKKVYDSLLIFSDIVGCGISDTRINMDYILVYNESKNLDANIDGKTEISVSSARDKIAQAITEMGHQHFIKYGLDIFERYCFKSVYTYTEQEFHEKFVNAPAR